MKSALLLLSLSLTAFGENQARPPVKFRDAVTHDRLVRALRQADRNDPMKAMTQVTGDDPSKKNQPTNLMEDSDIICFQGLATLVPKQAILVGGNHLRSRLRLLPGARIVGWTEFFSVNRGWITTVEVSRAQAEGNQPLPEQTVDHIGKSKNLVVATFLGGPISVLPPKPTEAANPTAQTQP